MRKVVFALALLLAPSLASAQQAGPYFRLRLQASGFTPPTGYLNVYAKSSNKHLYSKDADGNEVDLTGGGSGTVTSVGMTVPSFLSVSGSPITGSGTLALSLGTQVANRVFAGPSTGADAAPTFRALVAADLPNTAVSAGTCTACDLTIDAQGRITAKASGAGGGGTTQTIDVINATAATQKQLTAAVADSGSNVGFILNNSTTLTGSTKLLSLRNNGTERLALQWDGSNDPVLYANPGSLNFTIKSASATSIRLDSGTSLIMPIADNSQRLGWTTAYWVSVHSRQYMTALGAQLTAAATITPTTGLHHVTGATTIDTIAATNFADNAQLTLLADGGTITWSASGNIMTAGTITQDKAQVFFYDATAAKWYAQQ